MYHTLGHFVHEVLGGALAGAGPMGSWALGIAEVPTPSNGERITPGSPEGPCSIFLARRGGRSEAGRAGGAAPGARSRRTSVRAGTWGPAGAGAGALPGPGTGATPPAHLHASANAPCTTSSNVCIVTEEESVQEL